MIYAVETDHVDVINMSIGGLPALNDGNNARAMLYNRLIDDNNVQMFISAGNDGPGMNTVGDPAVATKVMGVGAYITKDDLAARTTAPTRQLRRQPASVQLARPARGRRASSRRLVAPGAAISTTPTVAARPARCGGTYTLPPGLRACSTARRWPRRRPPARLRC